MHFPITARFRIAASMRLMTSDLLHVQEGRDRAVGGSAPSPNLKQFSATILPQAGAKELVAEGATIGESPAAVVAACPIVFAMVSDPKAAEALVFMPKGVLEGMGPGKAYIDVSTGVFTHARTRTRARAFKHVTPLRRAASDVATGVAPTRRSLECCCCPGSLFRSAQFRLPPYHRPSILYPSCPPHPVFAYCSGRRHVPEDRRGHHGQGGALPRGTRERQQEASHRFAGPHPHPLSRPRTATCGSAADRLRTCCSRPLLSRLLFTTWQIPILLHACPQSAFLLSLRPHHAATGAFSGMPRLASQPSLSLCAAFVALQTPSSFSSAPVRSPFLTRPRPPSVRPL